MSFADFFFKIIFFSKNYFRNTIRVSNTLDHSVSLIWVQTVCKGYQQMKKVATSSERAVTYPVGLEVLKYKERVKFSYQG